MWGRRSEARSFEIFGFGGNEVLLRFSVLLFLFYFLRLVDVGDLVSLKVVLDVV